MTSNAGTRQLSDFGKGVGFNAATDADNTEQDKQRARSILQKSLSKQFAPEFLNRLDEIIMFSKLDHKAIRHIVDIELNALGKRITSMGYSITISEEAKDFLATKGFDAQFGARPLKRAIQTYIEDELCNLLLSDKIKEGSNIVIDKDPADEKLKVCINTEDQ